MNENFTLVVGLLLGYGAIRYLRNRKRASRTVRPSTTGRDHGVPLLNAAEYIMCSKTPTGTMPSDRFPFLRNAADDQ
jgi:hypothetical protein